MVSVTNQLPEPPSEADLKKLQQNAAAASALLKALSNPHRLMILCTLAGREMTVGEINERVGLSQSSLSQQLAILRREGLVRTRRQSQMIYYSLAPSNAPHIIGTLKNLYCGA